MEGELGEILPKQGLVEQEARYPFVLCKPKLLALKSVTLEKLETMQREAQEQVRAQENLEQGSSLVGIGGSTNMLDADSSSDSLRFEASDYASLTRDYYSNQ